MQLKTQENDEIYVHRCELTYGVNTLLPAKGLFEKGQSSKPGQMTRKQGEAKLSQVNTQLSNMNQWLHRSMMGHIVEQIVGMKETKLTEEGWLDLVSGSWYKVYLGDQSTAPKSAEKDFVAPNTAAPIECSKINAMVEFPHTHPLDKRHEVTMDKEFEVGWKRIEQTGGKVTYEASEVKLDGSIAFNAVRQINCAYAVKSSQAESELESKKPQDGHKKLREYIKEHYVEKLANADTITHVKKIAASAKGADKQAAMSMLTDVLYLEFTTQGQNTKTYDENQAVVEKEGYHSGGKMFFQPSLIFADPDLLEKSFANTNDEAAEGEDDESACKRKTAVKDAEIQEDMPLCLLEPEADIQLDLGVTAGSGAVGYCTPDTNPFQIMVSKSWNYKWHPDYVKTASAVAATFTLALPLGPGTLYFDVSLQGQKWSEESQLGMRLMLDKVALGGSEDLSIGPGAQDALCSAVGTGVKKLLAPLFRKMYKALVGLVVKEGDQDGTKTLKAKTLGAGVCKAGLTAAIMAFKDGLAEVGAGFSTLGNTAVIKILKKFFSPDMFLKQLTGWLAKAGKGLVKAVMPAGITVNNQQFLEIVYKMAPGGKGNFNHDTLSFADSKFVGGSVEGGSGAVNLKTEMQFFFSRTAECGYNDEHDLQGVTTTKPRMTKRVKK